MYQGKYIVSEEVYRFKTSWVSDNKRSRKIIAVLSAPTFCIQLNEMIAEKRTNIFLAIVLIDIGCLPAVQINFQFLNIAR